MKLLQILLIAFGALLWACSGRRLPPGTPPPEYETPLVAPWPASSAGHEMAGVDGGAAPMDAGAADLSPDAGVR